MRTVRVLFGFNHDLTSRAIVSRLESYDLKVDASYRFTKITIRDFIEKNTDLDFIFLKEYLDGGEKYGALEISDLADTSRSKFIAVMRGMNKGREAMKILYCAGLLDCVFAEGRAGADPKLLADLAMHGRTRLEARRYYRIDAPMPDYGVLSFEDYRDCYDYLSGRDIEEGTMIGRFIDLSKFLSPKQLSRFIDNLPKEDLDDLLMYDEFYDIQGKLYSMGVSNRRFKKPKNLRKAISEDPGYLYEEPDDAFEERTPLRSVPPVPEGQYQEYGEETGSVSHTESPQTFEHRPSNLGSMVYQSEPVTPVREEPLVSMSSFTQIKQRKRLSEMSLDEMLKTYSG